MSGYGGPGAKAASGAGFREMGKSLGLWEKMISNIWRSFREFSLWSPQSPCSVSADRFETH